MSKKIDWMYDRKACNTCRKARDFLREASCEVKATENAAKVRHGRADALALLDGMDKMVAMKGKSVGTFNLKMERPEDQVLLAHLMGPTGNLRAPTAKIGKTLIIGFNEEAYQQLF